MFDFMLHSLQKFPHGLLVGIRQVRICVLFLIGLEGITLGNSNLKHGGGRGLPNRTVERNNTSGSQPSTHRSTVIPGTVIPGWQIMCVLCCAATLGEIVIQRPELRILHRY